MIIKNIIPLLSNESDTITGQITDIFDKYSIEGCKHYIYDNNFLIYNDLILIYIRINGITIGNIYINKFTYKIYDITYDKSLYKSEIQEELNQFKHKILLFITNDRIVATKVNLASIIPDSLVNGEGVRNVIYFQGCSLKCPGCFNTHTWEFGKGKDFTIDEVINEISNNYISKDVTLSGGHPLEQSEACSKLCYDLKKQFNSNIWLYTGFNFEKILSEAITRPSYRSILYNVDVIVDGKFDENLCKSNLKYKGSENQRIIDVKQSLLKNDIIEIKY